MQVKRTTLIISSSVFFIIFIISRHALLETVIRPQPKGLLTGW
jgi:hypothetical protein